MSFRASEAPPSFPSFRHSPLSVIPANAGIHVERQPILFNGLFSFEAGGWSPAKVRGRRSPSRKENGPSILTARVITLEDNLFNLHHGPTAKQLAVVPFSQSTYAWFKNVRALFRSLALTPAGTSTTQPLTT